MGFFKKRSGAILVFFAVVILASFFAANRSLSSKVQEINDLFSDGVYDPDRGYRLPSIRRQLEVRANASNNLLSLGRYFPESNSETEALSDVRTRLINGLSNSSGASKLYDINKELDAAFNALYKKLNMLTLTEKERDMADDLFNEWENTAALIQKSRYNEAVREFSREVLSVFPTNYVMKYALVNPPELFE